MTTTPGITLNTKQPTPPKFQHYKSARTAMRLITDKGKKIIFTGYEFLTQDLDIIAYLDEQISLGLPGITKGKLMTREESNPMEVLKKKHFEEFKNSQIREAANKAAGISKDMGTTKTAGASAVNPSSTNNVAN